MDAKIGDKVWIIDDKKAKEVVVEFIGNNQIAFTLDGKLCKRADSEIFADEHSANFKIQGLDLIVFCREICRQTGEVAVYKIDVSMNDYSLGYLGFRTRFNPELQYAVTYSNFFEEVKEQMKDSAFFDKLIEESKIIRL